MTTLRDYLFHEEPGITLYCGDVVDVLPLLSRVGMVVADPPYVLSMSSTAQEGKAGSWGDMMNGARWYASWLREVDRLTRESAGVAWIFNSWRSFPILARAAYEAPWPIESLLVWDKGPEVGMGGLRGLRSMYELVALFVQPEFKIVNRSTRDIWNVPWGGSVPRANHPAEKPTALLSRIVEVSGRAAPVLDPFIGGGSTLMACKDIGVPVIGIEIEPKYCEIAVKRLRQEVLPFRAIEEAGSV